MSRVRITDMRRTRSPSPPNQVQADLYLDDLGGSWTGVSHFYMLKLLNLMNLLPILYESCRHVSLVALVFQGFIVSTFHNRIVLCHVCSVGYRAVGWL